MTDNKLKEEQIERASNMLKALAHPYRIRILEILKNGEPLQVYQIQEQLDCEQSATSHHLSILKNKGVVCSTRNGRNIFYHIKHPVLGQIIECMQQCTCNETE